MLEMEMETHAWPAGPRGHSQLPFLGPRQGKPALLSWAQAPHLSSLKGKDDSWSQGNQPEAAGARQMELRFEEVVGGQQGWHCRWDPSLVTFCRKTGE